MVKGIAFRRRIMRLHHRPERPKMSRFWSIPGALGFGPEPFEGAAILEEVPDGLAPLLWQMLRDVDLWLATDRRGVRRLFAPEAAENRARHIEAVVPHDAPVRQPLTELARGLTGPRGNAGEMGTACAALSRWASEEGFTRTAFAAALRAAAASPRDAARSLLAGVTARRTGDYVRAEAWLNRTRALALRTGDGRHYGLSLMGLANVHMQRFEIDLAIRRLRQALGAARRFALWDLRGLAYHDLFLISATHGSPAEAARYAFSAVRGYGRFHPRLPALAHDLAWFLLLQGRPADALLILQALDDRTLRAPERLLFLSMVARAAGAAGERQVFWERWSDFWQWLDAVPSCDRAAEALVNIGWGAASLRDATRLEVAAR
jgi:tetratricopeptide (TPR) repeat protein